MFLVNNNAVFDDANGGVGVNITEKFKVYVKIGKGIEPSELYDGVNDKNFTVLSKKIFERVMELDAETRESLKK